MAEPETVTTTPPASEAPGVARDQAPESRAKRAAKGTVPDWAPGTVLAGLAALGLLGALGLVPLPFSLRAPSSAKPAAPPAPSAAALPPLSSALAAIGYKVPTPVADDGVRVSVSHLVVSHKDSRLGSRFGVTRTREEARQRATEALARARKGEPFAKLVAEYTDEPGAAKRDGMVGRMGRRQAIAGFEKVFDLKVGEISNVLETDLGFHVVLRRE